MEKKRHSQNGQAMLEMAIGLFAILVVFCGLMFVAALGNDNIECLIDANKDAALGYAQGLTGGSAGTSASEWDAGNDGILYTNDDIIGGAANADASTFTQELNPASLEEAYQVNTIFAKNYVANRDFARLPSDNLFLQMASLNCFYSIKDNSLKERGLSDLENSFRILFGTKGNFTITHTVFYPDSD